MNRTKYQSLRFLQTPTLLCTYRLKSDTTGIYQCSHTRTVFRKKYVLLLLLLALVSLMPYFCFGAKLDGSLFIKFLPFPRKLISCQRSMPASDGTWSRFPISCRIKRMLILWHTSFLRVVYQFRNLTLNISRR